MAETATGHPRTAAETAEAQACVIVYIAGFAFSLGPVFWLMISEIFPLQHRSKAMAICTIFNWAANFIVSYFFLQEVGAIGKPATFWIYAFLGVLATGFIWLRVPETKGKSLEQIEAEVGVRPEGSEQPERPAAPLPLPSLYPRRPPVPSPLQCSVSHSGRSQPT